MTEAEEAAALWGGRILRPLRLRENEVYELDLGNRRAALRLHRQGYQSSVAIRSELWWCSQLGRKGLPVASPIDSRAGAALETLTTGRSASVVTWVNGQALGEAGVPLPGTLAEKLAQHRALGALLARIHSATDLLALPEWFQRPSWDRKGLVGEAPFWGRFWDHPNLNSAEHEVLIAARHWLDAMLRRSRSPLGLIHADVLRENVFVQTGGLALIDFDDSGFGYRWYDLGTVLSQDLYQPDYAQLRAALLQGYGQVLPVDGAEVDAFTLARTLASVGWAATRLPLDHPVHRSHIDRALMMSRRLLGLG